MKYLFHYMPQAPKKKWVDANKAYNIPVTTYPSIFFFFFFKKKKDIQLKQLF